MITSAPQDALQTLGSTEPQVDYPDVFGINPVELPADKAVKEKTSRIMFGLGSEDKDVTEPYVTAQVANGSEAALRKRLATNEDNAQFKVKQQVLQEIIKSRPDGRVTPQEYNAVMNLGAGELTDPATIVEKKFARKVVDTTLTRDGGDTYKQALEEDPQATDTLLGEFEKRTAFSSALKDIVTDMEDRAAKQGWVGWGIDLTKSLFVPFYNTYKRGQMSQDGSTVDAALFPGDTFQKERERLFSLPTVEEFKKQVRASLEKISADNPQLGAEFAKELMDYTIGDQFWTSAFGTLDIAAVTGLAADAVKLGARASKLTRAVKDTADVVKDVGKVVAHPNSTLKDAVAATGDIRKAVETAALTEPNTVKGLAEALPPGSSKEAVAKWLDAHVPSIAVPDAAFPDTPFDKAKGYVANLGAVLRENSQFALKALFDTNVVSRVDQTAAYQSGAMEQAHKAVVDLFGSNTSNAVVDMKFISGGESGVNIDRVAVDLGKSDGTLFDTEKSARAAIKRTYGISVDPNSLETTKVGEKYAIRFTRNVNELDPAMRDFILYNDTKTPVSTVKMFLGHISSADANLSKSQNQVRSIATSAHQELSDLISAMARPIGAMDKKESSKLFALMDDAASRVKQLPDGTLSRGKFFRSQKEFSDNYFTKFGEYPSEKQVKAYFTAVQLNDLDYTLRNLNMYQAKASKGVGEIKFTLQVPSKAEEGVWEKVQTKGVEGLYVDRLPLDGSENVRVMVIEKNGSHNIFDLKNLTTEQKNILEAHITKTNSKVAKVFDPASNPMKDYLPNYKEGIPIEYVVSPNSVWGKLSMTQIPYNEGGHAIENAGFRVKSPKMLPTTNGKMYGGDVTFSSHVIEAEAKQFAADMEVGRLAMKEATKAKPRGKPIDLSGVEKVLEERGLPFSAKEFAEFFASKGPLDLDMPIKMVRDGQRYSDVTDLNSLGIRDYMQSQHNMAGEIDRRFASERGLGSQSYAKGGANNAVWTPVKARMMDSRSIIQKTVGEIIKSRVYSDYIDRSSREFVEQFGHLLYGGKDKARQAPIFNLLHPVWKGNGDPRELAAAKKMQRAVSLLVYTPSEMSKQVTAAKNSILNSIYNKFGGKAAEYVEDSAIFKTRDPAKFARAMAFHTQIGLFNPVQMVLNTQTLFHMAAIAPKHAMGAMKDSVLMRFLNYNNDENIIKSLSKKSGYKHFEEMARELNRSGFGNIGGTTSYLDNALEPKTVQGKWGTFLDFGTVFFRESEGGLKRSAYAIAFREWKEANPTKAINDLARQQILGRAKVLNVQMSRDSQNLYQHGVWSIPLQFTSYNLRMTEQLLEGVFTGKGALTRGEAARVLGMYSVLYGLPTAAGAAVGIWPVYDSVKQYALENGIDLDTNMFTEFVSRGLLHTITDLSGDSKWNFAERWGPGNSALVSDILEGNTSVLEALTGPSGSILKNVAASGAPLLRSLTSVFSDDPDSTYPLTMDDALNASRNIAVVNNATRAFMAYNTGLWMTKNNVVQTEVDGTQALFAAILGLSPQEAVDAYPAMKVLSDRKQHQDTVVKEATKEWASYISNVRAGQMDSANDNLKRMKFLVVAAGVNPLEANEIMTRIIQTHADQWSELEMRLIKSSRTPEEFLSRIQKRQKDLNKKAKE